MIYLMTLSVAQTMSYDGMIYEWLIGKDMEGSGRGLI
jgi:hypothetical protein